AGAFARYSDPQALIDAELGVLGDIGDDLRRAGHANLGAFVSLRPQQGQPLLVVAARYFFRRAVEEDDDLARGLTFAQLEGLQHTQEAAFGALNRALVEQGARLAKMLDEVQDTLHATHSAVLDIRLEQQRQGEQHRDIYLAVIDLQNKLDLMNREVR